MFSTGYIVHATRYVVQKKAKNCTLSMNLLSVLSYVLYWRTFLAMQSCVRERKPLHWITAPSNCIYHEIKLLDSC